MSKTLKVIIIILLVLLVVLGGVLEYVYLKSASVNKKESTPVVTQKDENTKELESINTEIKNSDNLDLADVNSVSSELDQIDISGL